MRVAMRLRRREQGGFVMIVMLAVLALMLVVASIMYARALTATLASTTLKRHAIAQDRALIGMQRAIGEINSGVPSPQYSAFDADTTQDCLAMTPEGCPANTNFPRYVKDKGTAMTLDNGGGYQYAYEFFWWNPGPMPTPATRMKVVRAFGYLGYANPAVACMAGAQCTYESEVLVEIGAGTATASTSGGGGYAGN